MLHEVGHFLQKHDSYRDAYICSCSPYSGYMIIIFGTEVLNPRHNNLESLSHPNENLIRRQRAEDIFTSLQMNERFMWLRSTLND